MATIYRPCYVTREELKRALDIKETARSDDQLDRAIQAASDGIDGGDAHPGGGLLHRRFYPEDRTVYINWPNFQRAYPWRIWLDANELADVTSNVPVVTSGGNVITAADIFWGPWSYSPPYTFLELDRSTSASFGQGSTPQRDVSIQGTFGFWVKTDPAGTLAAAMTDTTGTTAVVSDGSLIGVGDLLLAGSERLLVTGRASYDTGQTIASGGTTAAKSDNAITIQDGTKVFADEVVLIGSERMLVVDVTGNVLTVKRGWDGSVLAAHAASDKVYAYRSLTVVRAATGSTAATHSLGGTVSRCRVPGLVKDLALALAENSILQGVSGYSRTVGSGQGKQKATGDGLSDIIDRCWTAYGRKARTRVI